MQPRMNSCFGFCARFGTGCAVFGLLRRSSGAGKCLRDKKPELYRPAPRVPLPHLLAILAELARSCKPRAHVRDCGLSTGLEHREPDADTESVI